MSNASPTILTVETASAWVVIVAVSLVTLVAALFVRKVIDRPGGLLSGILLAMPLSLPLAAALIYHRGVLPEVAVLRPAGQALLESGGFARLLLLLDDSSGAYSPYVFSGTAGRLLLVVGLSATTFMLVRRLVGHAVMRQLMKRCVPLEEPHRAAVEPTVARLARDADLKRPPQVLVLPEGTTGAFAVGARKGKILVAREVLTELDDRELEGVLAHEIAHLEARDVSLLTWAGFLRDIVAWNPFSHVAMRCLTRDRELEADRRAAQLTGRPLSLASGLLKLCEQMRRSGRVRTVLVAPQASGGALSRRVGHLLALADSRAANVPTGRFPYLIATCMVAALGLVAAARLANQEVSRFVIVWGAPEVGDEDVWSLKAHMSRMRIRSEAAARMPLDAFALRKQDVPEWLKAMRRWARSKKLPSTLLAREGWQGVPVFADTKLGPIGIYRVEPGIVPAQVAP